MLRLKVEVFIASVVSRSIREVTLYFVHRLGFVPQLLITAFVLGIG